MSNWIPIEQAPKDNKRPLYLAQFASNGRLVELDWDATWEAESESWEMPQIYYIWRTANGRVEEPTHFAYMDEPLPPIKLPNVLSMFADALDCFWNPATQHVRDASYHGPASGADVVSAIAVGLAAVANRLRELDDEEKANAADRQSRT